MKTTILLLFLVLTSCTTDVNLSQDQLPPITTIGANTAGCLIDGKVLIPKNGIFSSSGFVNYGLDYVVGPHFSRTTGDDYFALEIDNHKDKNFYLTLQLPSLINGIGDYPIGQSNGEYGLDAANNPAMILHVRSTTDTIKKYYSSTNSGTINLIRCDLSGNIISGTFNCTLYNIEDPADIIEITDGRFDINLLTL